MNLNNQGRVIIQHEDEEVTITNPFPVTIGSTNSTLAEYIFHDLEDTGSDITYIGKEKNDGVWLMTEMDTTSGLVLKYANVGNNGSYATYTTAWTNRATLTYDLIENLTGL